MKIRNGFVSNSSSSSFMCAICGRIESGYDASPGNFEMERCEEGHYYHTDCLYNKNIKEKFAAFLKLKEQYIEKNENNEDDEDNEDYDSSEVPSKYCPICQKIVISDSDILEHILKTCNMDVEKIKDEIRENFNKENKNENT